jgi:hypothetical protein
MPETPNEKLTANSVIKKNKNKIRANKQYVKILVDTVKTSKQ